MTEKMKLSDDVMNKVNGGYVYFNKDKWLVINQRRKTPQLAVGMKAAEKAVYLLSLQQEIEYSRQDMPVEFAI